MSTGSTVQISSQLQLCSSSERHQQWPIKCVRVSLANLVAERSSAATCAEGRGREASH